MMRLQGSIAVLLTFLLSFLCLVFDESALELIPKTISNPLENQPARTKTSPRCALLFFGLPRGYENLALPSIVKNVLHPNRKYGCDVYAHAVLTEHEEADRSGRGGTIDRNALFLLKNKVQEVANSTTSWSPHIDIQTETEEEYLSIQNATLFKFHNSTTSDGKPLYFPTRSTWTIQSMDNAIKAWHSIHTVWNMMENYSHEHDITYDRVAALRSDVFYVTPIDIYQHNETYHSSPQNNEKEAVIPGFAMYPVNDRMIYGSYDAVKIWASERFSRIDAHVRNIAPPGIGMQSEKFVNDSLLPAMREKNITIITNPDVCFIRVRADETMWEEDCKKNSQPKKRWHFVDTRKMAEEVLERSCEGRVYEESLNVWELKCPPTTNTTKL